MIASEYFELLSSRRLPIIVDSPDVVPLVEGHGFRAVYFDDFAFDAKEVTPALMLLTRHAYHDRLKALWNTTPHILSHLALAKFDRSMPTVAYSFERFLAVDFLDTLRRRKHYYDALIAAPVVEVITSAGVMTCRFSDTVEVANQDENLEPGWLYSVAEFFEASIINLAADGSSYRLDGPFAFEGFIYLCNSIALEEQLSDSLQQLSRLSRQGNNQLHFEHNHVVKAIMGGQDVTELFLSLVKGKEREASSTEFAIGCVESETPHDWNLNSLLHESAHGVHVGVGMARQIPHMDFIAPGAQCRFLTHELAHQAGV